MQQQILVGNIENMLYQTRVSTPLRPMSRYSPYNRYEPRDDSRVAYLERLNSLLNSTNYIPTPRRNPFNEEFQNTTRPASTPAQARTPNYTQIPTPAPAPAPAATPAPAPAPAPGSTEPPVPSPSRIEALIFRSLVESLNNQLPVNTQVYPNVLRFHIQPKMYQMILLILYET